MEKKKIKTVQLASADGESELPLTGDYASRLTANEYAGRPAANDYATIKTRLGADTPTIVVHSTYGEDDGGASALLQNKGKTDSSPPGLPSPDEGAEGCASPPERPGRQTGRGALSTANTLEGQQRKEKLPSRMLALQVANSGTKADYESKDGGGLDSKGDYRIS